MGLFDTVIIKDINLPRPEGFIGDLPTNYQTKDLNCSLDTYYLTNGKLMLEKVEGSWVESTPEERKRSRWNVGHFNIAKKELVPFSHYGVVNFYTGITDYSEDKDAWIEFDAQIDGTEVKGITLKSFELRDNSFRKQGEQELKERFEREEELAKSKKRFVVYSFRWVKRLISKILRKIGGVITKFGNYLNKISYKIN